MSRAPSVHRIEASAKDEPKVASSTASRGVTASGSAVGGAVMR